MCRGGVFENVLFIVVSVFVRIEAAFEFELVVVSVFLELKEMMGGYDAGTGWQGRYIDLFLCTIVVDEIVGDCYFENPTASEL